MYINKRCSLFMLFELGKIEVGKEDWLCSILPMHLGQLFEKWWVCVILARDLGK